MHVASSDRGPAVLAEEVAAAAAEAERWDRAARNFRDVPDANLETARAEMRTLADRLEQLLGEAEVSAPDDRELISRAALALRRARAGEVWAGYVLHMRKPAPDFSELI
jgi:hypothetical protein